jgi:RecB family exonuclease
MSEKHAKFSPSSFKLREACPAYQPREKQADTSAADEGSEIHEMLEYASDLARRKNASYEQIRLIGMIEGYTAPMVHTAQEDYREFRLDLSDLGIPECTHGTADRILKQEGGVYDLIDYKLGRIPVDDPECNIQIWIYACGVFNRFKDCQVVRAHILQPRCDEVGVHTFYRKLDMERMLRRARDIAHKAIASSPEMKPQNDVCRFCEKYFTCPAVAQTTLELSSSLALDPITKEDIALMNVDSVRAERVYKACRFLEDWAKNTRELIVRLAESKEIHLSGYKVVRVKGKESLTNYSDVYKLMQEKFGLSAQDLLNCASVSKNELIECHAQKHDTDITNSKNLITEELEKHGLLTLSPGYSYLKEIK